MLDPNNKKRNEKYIRFLKNLLEDEEEIAKITSAANTAAQQAIKDLKEIFGVIENQIHTQRQQILATALYGAILTHYAELRGYTSIIAGKEYERAVHPSDYIILSIHLTTVPEKQDTDLTRNIISTVRRIEQSFTKLGGRIEPTEEQVNN
jgi:hemoglobin-like flavoprotein